MPFSPPQGRIGFADVSGNRLRGSSSPKATIPNSGSLSSPNLPVPGALPKSDPLHVTMSNMSGPPHAGIELSL
jgi:hypothetical protein